MAEAEEGFRMDIIFDFPLSLNFRRDSEQRHN